jgi:hypothetical protein
MKEHHNVKLSCLNDINKSYAKEISKYKLQSKNIQNIFLKDLIQQKWDEHNMDPKKIVLCSTICSRVVRWKLVCENRGTRPVLPKSVKKDIVNFAVSMAKFRHPLSVCEIVDLANSLIQNKEYEDNVI